MDFPSSGSFPKGPIRSTLARTGPSGSQVLYLFLSCGLQGSKCLSHCVLSARMHITRSQIGSGVNGT